MPIAPPPPGYVPRLSDNTKATHITTLAPPEERKLPLLEGATCYYWDRNQKDKTWSPCSKGDSCTYLHKYEERLPIAPPPPPSNFLLSDASRYPSTLDFPPWVDDSSETNQQDDAPLPPWRSGSGDMPQAGPAQEDVSRQVPDLNTVLQRLRPTVGGPMDSVRGPQPESPLKEVSTPVKEAASRPEWDVYNPTKAVCYFWYNSGGCSKGSSCKYYHDDSPSLPLAPSVTKQQKTFSQTICRDWVNGYCRYTDHECRYVHRHLSHKREEEVTRSEPMRTVREEKSSVRPEHDIWRPPASRGSGETQRGTDDLRTSDPSIDYSRRVESIVPIAKTRPSWDPFDPFNSICHFWHTTGRCTKGNDCEYIHSDDPNLPICPAPKEHTALRAAARVAREEAARRYISEGEISAQPRRDDPEKSRENRNGQSNLVQDDPAPSQVLLATRDNSSLELQRKATLEAQVTIDNTMPPSQRSSSHSTSKPITSSSPRVKARPAWNPRDPLNAICYFWSREGACPAQRECQYIHSNDPDLAVAPSPMDIPGRPAYELGDSHNAICRHLATTGSCFSPACRYVHSNDPALPIAPDSSVCTTWLRGKCRYTARNCKWRHALEPGKQVADPGAIDSGRGNTMTGSTPTGPRKTVSFAIDEPEEDATRDRLPLPARLAGTKHPETMCVYWSNGYCFKGDNCPYRHGYLDEDRSGPTKTAELHGRHQDIGDVEMKGMDDVALSALPRKRSVTFDPMIESHSSESRESEPVSTDKAKIAAQPQNTTSKSSSELPIPSSDSMPLDPKPKQKIKIDDYRRKKVLKELGTRSKEVIFGSEETQSILLDFGDTTQALELPWGRLFSVFKKLKFDLMCIAQDFQAQQRLIEHQRHWHGNLFPADLGDAEAVKALDKVADELIRRSAGLLASMSDYVILVFPSKKEEWKFLESTLSFPQDARLRYLVFQSKMDIRQCLKMNSPSLAIGAPYRKMLADRIHKLDYKKLLPAIRNQKKPINFFLFFPSTASQTADFMVTWLRSCSTSCKIYSSQKEGAWHYFTHTPEIENGVVLIHESMAPYLYQLSNLYNVVAEKNFTFWYLSENSSPKPLYPSTPYRYDDSNMGLLSTVRLFPHGCAFLLTPSFVVSDPHGAKKLVEWFLIGSKAKYLRSTAGTWKLVCPHGFTNWVLDLACAKADEANAMEEKYKDDPARDARLHEAGLSYNECLTRFELHGLLVDFSMSRPLEEDSDLSDYEDSDIPLVRADREIDPDDEKTLREWFLVWSLRNLDMYRKFVIVGSSEKKPALMRYFKTVEVVKKKEPAPALKADFKGFEITKMSSASPMESPQSPISAQKQKALAVASKLSASPARNGNLDRNPFDGMAMAAASSPSRHSRHSSVPSQRADIVEQVNDLIMEEANKLLHLNTTAKSRTNDTTQLGGADDRSADMDLDSPMLGFDGAGDERPTSSSSNTSRSGIQSDENGRRFVPRSVRPNASIRKEISVRPGHVPPEDKEVYQIPSRRGSAAGTPIRASPAPASPAPALDSKDRMDVDSSDGGGSGSLGGGSTSTQEKQAKKGLTKSRWAPQASESD